MSVPAREPVLTDEEAARRCLEHAFRHVSKNALKNVDFADVVAHFTNHRRSLCRLFGEPSQEADTAFRQVVFHVNKQERFLKFIERIATWSDYETAYVSSGQVRNVARAVRDGVTPTYPPFDYPSDPEPSLSFDRSARQTR